jgi:UDP-glucose 4-epimerase
MDDSMSVLITGACGFLGLATTELFLKQGYDVTVLDLPDVLQRMPPKLAENPGLQSLAVDLVNDDFKSKLPERIDFVVHLAGLASARESFKHPNQYERVNVDGTKALLDALKDHKLSKFVFSSTAAVYGTESSDNTDENTPMDPKSPYAKSKMLAEQIVTKQGKSHGFKTVILRFFNIYGSGQKLEHSGIVSLFIRSMIDNGKIEIIGDGSRTRSFIHVQDCARAILLSCSVKTDDHIVVNVCGEDSTSIEDLAKELVKVSGRTDIVIEYTPKEDQLIMKSGCTGNVAKTLLGFTPQISLTEGLRNTYRTLSG